MGLQGRPSILRLGRPPIHFVNTDDIGRLREALALPPGRDAHALLLLAAASSSRTGNW